MINGPEGITPESEHEAIGYREYRSAADARDSLLAEFQKTNTRFINVNAGHRLQLIQGLSGLSESEVNKEYQQKQIPRELLGKTRIIEYSYPNNTEGRAFELIIEVDEAVRQLPEIDALLNFDPPRETEESEQIDRTLSMVINLLQPFEQEYATVVATKSYEVTRQRFQARYQEIWDEAKPEDKDTIKQKQALALAKSYREAKSLYPFARQSMEALLELNDKVVAKGGTERSTLDSILRKLKRNVAREGKAREKLLHLARLEVVIRNVAEIRQKMKENDKFFLEYPTLEKFLQSIDSTLTPVDVPPTESLIRESPKPPASPPLASKLTKPNMKGFEPVLRPPDPPKPPVEDDDSKPIQ